MKNNLFLSHNTRLVRVFLFVYCCLMSGSCSDENSKDPGGSSANENLVIMTDPNDPLLLQAKDAHGDLVEYYGDRDAEGLPLRVTHIIYKQESGENIYALDESGRINKMIAANGVEFTFEWLSEKQAALTVVTKDGENQINTMIDFDNPEGGRLAAASNQPLRNIRAGKSISLSATSVKESVLQNQKTAATGNVNVNVNACGVPSSATVFVKVSETTSGNHVGSFPAKMISQGIYQTSIPTDNLPIKDNRQYCEALADVIGNVCMANEVFNASGGPLICVQLSIIAAGISGPGAAFVLAACEALSLTADVTCLTLGFDGGFGGKSVIEKMCESKFLDREFEDLTVSAYALGIPNNIYSSPQVVNGGQLSGNTLNFNLDLGSKTAVRSLALVPSAPAAGQDYQSIASVYCLPIGATISLSVLGTDGYRDETSMTVSSNQKETEFTLGVPGADSGVQDVVTLQITVPGQESITRTASLVFN